MIPRRGKKKALRWEPPKTKTYLYYYTYYQCKITNIHW